MSRHFGPRQWRIQDLQTGEGARSSAAGAGIEAPWEVGCGNLDLKMSTSSEF